MLIIIGLVLLGGAGAMLFFANRSKSRVATLAAAPTVPVKDLGSVGATVVEVVGTAAAVGPQLVSPVGQQACAWFSLTVHEIYTERDTDANGHTTTRTKERLQSRETSSTPIAIDDGTGVVLVELDDLNVDQPVLAVDRRLDDDDSFAEELLSSLVSDVDGLRQREHVIPVGQRLFAIGAVAAGSDGPRLTKPTEKGQPFLVSTRDEAALQKSAASTARWLTVGAVVAALAGVALVIAGAAA